MNHEDLENIINNSNSFTTAPQWMARAIESHTKNMTVYLAESKLYKVNLLDRVLGTMPLIQKINMEVN